MHRDVPNRTNTQLLAEHDYLRARLFAISAGALRRYAAVAAELQRRGVVKTATYNA